ncbi:PREDICTED: transmembrane and coiled-coil domains protein 1-like [Amphimedon queenslandica]|uniref:Uncharacterized protein n=1 Tax=Amphimedon queenslandica TaxID=400682 RepID=A0A1X7V7C2_AMPQE|nr:PREDICTED: transmembrane and coiled-coil domains protein 1-like [Amphimedon queenslandica]|eukprot:XP_003385363.1 PREDICTED: transmembrane and coiled-coil domains protein 1-like [Amphimedon queenslandica]
MASPPSSYSLSHLSSSSSLPPLTSSPVAPFDLSTVQHQPNSLNNNNNDHSTSVNSVTSSLLSDRRSSSPGAMDSIGDHHHSSSLSPNYSHYYYTGGGGGSVTSMTPQLVSIREVETHGTPTASPIMRPASGRFVGGVKKLLRIPSGPQAAGVSASTVQAELSSVTNLSSEATPGGIDHPPGDLETNERSRIFRKVMKQIKRHPRVLHPAFRRPHPIRRKGSDRSRNRHHHHHYSGDDGYTSDPGLLRDAIHASHDEDPEEEEDTESGDREGEVRAERIARIQMKLEKYKKLLQEEETALQEAQNVYVVGMEESNSDKEQHRIKKHFISKQAKSKDEIDQLKRKVEHYEEQLQEIKQGRGHLVVTSHHMRYNKVRNHFSRIRHLGSGGVKHGIKILRRKKTPNSPNQDEAVIDVEDDDEEEETYHPVDDIEADSHASFNDDHHIDMKEDDPPCEYCLNEYTNLMDIINEHKKTVSLIQQDHALLLEKLQQEKDKTDRLENELNTLTDLHQNGIIELRGQLAQMERLSFGKSQDLEDNIENCQARLHSLEVKVTNTDALIPKPVRNGLARSIFVPFLSYMLSIISICFKLSEHMGKKTLLAIFIIVIGIIIYYSFLF